MSSAVGLVAVISDVREAMASGAKTLPAGTSDRLRGLAASAPDVRIEDGLVSLVAVAPVSPLGLADLEAAFGSAARVPRLPDSGRQIVMFAATLPAEGEAGGTVLAELDEAGDVTRVLIRRDEF